MQIPLVMTIIGPDRTGLVEAVARAVADHGGNWLESRMCRLGGEFAGILRVEIPAEKKSALLDAFKKFPASLHRPFGRNKNLHRQRARKRNWKSSARTVRASSMKFPPRWPAPG